MGSQAGPQELAGHVSSQPASTTPASISPHLPPALPIHPAAGPCEVCWCLPSSGHVPSGWGPKGRVGGHHAEGLVGQLSAHVRTVHARVQGEQTALPSFTPMPPELMGPKGGRAPHRHTRRRALTPGSQHVASNRRRQRQATQIRWTVPRTTSTVPCSMPGEKPGGLLLWGQPLRPGVSGEPFPEPPGPWAEPTEHKHVDTVCLVCKNDRSALKTEISLTSGKVETWQLHFCITHRTAEGGWDSGPTPHTSVGNYEGCQVTGRSLEMCFRRGTKNEFCTIN